MAKLEYGRSGKNGKLIFESYNDFYVLLGILTSQRHTKIFLEKNEESGAWGSEGRIHVYTDLSIFPPSVINRATAGVGKIVGRVNCNELVIDLMESHAYSEINTPGQSTIEIVPSSVINVERTVPAEYYDFFIAGLEI